MTRRLLTLALVALVIIGGTVAAHIYDKHIAEDAVVKESATRFERERESLKDSLAASRKQFRTDTIYAIKTERAYVTIHDSALAHITDTVLVKATIERADTAIRACKAVVFTCAQTNRLLTAQLAVSDSMTMTYKKLVPSPTQRVLTAAKWAAIGGSAVYILAHLGVVK